ENDDRAIERRSPRDLDHLLARERQVAHNGTRIEIVPAIFKNASGIAVELFRIEAAAPQPGEIAEEDIFGNAQFGDKRNFLVDEKNASTLGIHGAGESYPFAAIAYRAAVLRETSCHDAHECTFAGAVFAA